MSGFVSLPSKKSRYYFLFLQNGVISQVKLNYLFKRVAGQNLYDRRFTIADPH